MKKSLAHPFASLALATLVACGTEPAARVMAPGGEKARLDRNDERGDSRARFSAWSVPVNVGPPVNTAAAEQTPAISRDGLTLYFHCIDCPGGYGGTDIWFAERASIDAPWGTPQHLGPQINTSANESSPALSKDGRSLFFDSDRLGGVGGFDLYVSRRRDKRNNLGWEAPVNLGPGINTTANEQGAEFFASDDEGDDDETAAIYFGSNRVGGPGGGDIYSIPLHRDGTFGVPLLAEGLNTPARESGPTIRRDGLEIFFVSDRPGSLGVDIWSSTREKISDAWSTPINLGQPINSTAVDAGPALSFDGTALYFHAANRPGNVGGPFFDLWVVTREKMKGHAGGGD